MLALVVDDSRAIRTILTRTLSSFGFDTVEADNGRTGLEALRAMPAPPDVVLVDWHMPELDGLTFVFEVRSQPAWRNVRIVMVTNESEQRHIVRALAAGAHDYLIKPFTRDIVHDRLRQLGLVAEAASGPRSGERLRSEVSTGLAVPDGRVLGSVGAATDGTRSGIEVTPSGPRLCDCCANADAVVYYPLDEPFEQGDDEPPSSVDRIYVCARCFQSVETGHWSQLRSWIGSATDGRTVRHLWVGLRRHRVGSPVPTLQAPIVSWSVCIMPATP